MCIKVTCFTGVGISLPAYFVETIFQHFSYLYLYCICYKCNLCCQFFILLMTCRKSSWLCWATCLAALLERGAGQDDLPTSAILCFYDQLLCSRGLQCFQRGEISVTYSHDTMGLKAALVANSMRHLGLGNPKQRFLFGNQIMDVAAKQMLKGLSLTPCLTNLNSFSASWVLYILFQGIKLLWIMDRAGYLIFMLRGQAGVPSI